MNMIYQLSAIFVCALFGLAATELRFTQQVTNCDGFVKNTTGGLGGIITNVTGVRTNTSLFAFDNIVIVRTGRETSALVANGTVLVDVLDRLLLTLTLVQYEGTRIVDIIQLNDRKDLCGNLEKSDNAFENIIADMFAKKTKMCPLDPTIMATGSDLARQYLARFNNSKPGVSYKLAANFQHGLFSTCFGTTLFESNN